jgi:hypothetical protein
MGLPTTWTLLLAITYSRYELLFSFLCKSQLVLGCWQLTPEGLQSHIIASHQAAANPFEQLGLAHTLNLVAAREGLTGM